MYKPLHLIRHFAAALLALAASSAHGAATDPVEIKIGVSDNLAPSITRILEQYPDVCATDEFYSNAWLRTAAEFIIVCRAVRLGGLNATFSIQDFPNSARTRAELLRGASTIMIDLPWGDFSADESLYRSMSVLKVGDFVKGIYTRPDRSDVLGAKTVEDLRKFTAVSSKTWIYDWDALERMKVRKHAVPRYELMGKMVENRRADFLIAEFPASKDLSQYINGVRFVPVPGIKVMLLGSRHVAVSKRAPHAAQVFDAVQKGLAIMHETGLIKQAYRAVGFLNPRVETWEVVCCEGN